MSTVISVDIPASECSVQHALDDYYDFMLSVANAGAQDHVALLGTIIGFGVNKDTPLYNEFVVRAYADRTVQTSPVKWKTAGLGAGDLADQYSEVYTRMIAIIVQGIDDSISAENQQKLAAYQTKLKDTIEKKSAANADFNTKWLQYAQSRGLSPNDPAVRDQYFFEKTFYYRNNNYAELMKPYNDDIDNYENQIDFIRASAYPDDEARYLARLYKGSKSKSVRPRSTEAERKYGEDFIRIEDPQYADKTIFDIRALIFPLTDPVFLLNPNPAPGVRDWHASATRTGASSHDSAWHASAQASWLFYSGSVRTDSESHFRDSATKVRDVHIGFANIVELDIGRGDWFSSDVFSFARVKDYLKRNPRDARALALVTTGLVVGAGLTLTMTFQDADSYSEWSSNTWSGSGGVSFLGMGWGGDAGGSSSDARSQNDAAAFTVTFKDDPSVCRLLAIRCTDLMNTQNVTTLAVGARPFFELPDFIQASAAVEANTGGRNMHDVLMHVEEQHATDGQVRV